MAQYLKKLATNRKKKTKENKQPHQKKWGELFNTSFIEEGT